MIKYALNAFIVLEGKLIDSPNFSLYFVSKYCLIPVSFILANNEIAHSATISSSVFCSLAYSSQSSSNLSDFSRIRDYKTLSKRLYINQPSYSSSLFQSSHHKFFLCYIIYEIQSIYIVRCFMIIKNWFRIINDLSSI